MRWSRLHGDMQGRAIKEVVCPPVIAIVMIAGKVSSEIPCRVSELPGAEVISPNNRLITGKPSSYATPQGRRESERVIPWEVGTLCA
jgi:hypothetical protein